MAGEYETVLASVEEGVGTITINRPEVRNALGTQVLGDVRGALTEFRHDDRVGVVVFTGAGDRAFAAGADIGELRERTFLDTLTSTMQAVYDEVEAYEKPTIAAVNAAVNGLALGSGCELAMACDIRSAPLTTRSSGSRRWRYPSSPAWVAPNGSPVSSARAGP